MLVSVFWLGFTIRVMIAELARSAIAILAIFASQRFASTPPMLNAILRRSKMNATLKTSTTRPTAITLGFWAAIFASIFTLLFVLIAIAIAWLWGTETLVKYRFLVQSMGRPFQAAPYICFSRFFDSLVPIRLSKIS
jgi:hypothetical protein